MALTFDLYKREIHVIFYALSHVIIIGIKNQPDTIIYFLDTYKNFLKKINELHVDSINLLLSNEVNGIENQDNNVISVEMSIGDWRFVHSALRSYRKLSIDFKKYTRWNDKNTIMTKKRKIINDILNSLDRLDYFF